jgi:hypothetical protein
MKLTPLIPTFLAATGVALAASAMPAEAIGLSSSFVTGENYNIDGQFNIEITDAGAGQVSFTFTNVGNVNSSVTDVYFGKSGTINNYFSVPGAISNSTGVSFSEGAKPGQPPGGAFGWQAAYTADSNKPIVASGVNNFTGSGTQESLSFTFSTLNGNNAQSIFNAFSNPTGNPDLAIAFHVQGIGSNAEDSAWYGSKGITSKDIPEPLTMLGTTMAFGFGGLFKREYDKKKKREKVTA